MIKAFIIAAVTMDGFIAKDNAHSPMNWTSKDDKTRFVEITKRAGVVIMGANTFRTFPRPLKDRLNIVYSRTQQFEGTETVTEEPSKLLKKLEARGFTEVAICGGAEIYTKFIEAGVVNTIYLTTEPVLFGKGISLFSRPVDTKLELISTSKTESGTIFSEYKVIK
ncbi:MAG: dihydrofolate reductase family protein [Patescibacteria group bacterium]